MLMPRLEYANYYLAHSQCCFRMIVVVSNFAIRILENSSLLNQSNALWS